MIHAVQNGLTFVDAVDNVAMNTEIEVIKSKSVAVGGQELADWDRNSARSASRC
jgi:hypothetical protein